MRPLAIEEPFKGRIAQWCSLFHGHRFDAIVEDRFGQVVEKIHLSGHPPDASAADLLADPRLPDGIEFHVETVGSCWTRDHWKHWMKEATAAGRDDEVVRARAMLESRR